MEKATLSFCIHKIRQILKHFSRAFRRAQTLKLFGVNTLIYKSDMQCREKSIKDRLKTLVLSSIDSKQCTINAIFNVI